MFVRTKLLRWLPTDAVALPCAFGLPLAVIPDHCTSAARRLVGSWPAALFAAAVPLAAEGAARFLHEWDGMFVSNRPQFILQPKHGTAD